jgi:hypothetical protein
MPTYVTHLLSDIEVAIQTRKLALADKEQVRNALSIDEELRDDIAFAQHIMEVERYLQEDPPSDHHMYYHFGIANEQFPPLEHLTDSETDLLTDALINLWQAFNFDVVTPKDIPSRILYPLLLEKMKEPTFATDYGFTTFEFCDYECAYCPFGEQWCMCKEVGEED